MGRHSAPGQSATAPATPPLTILFEPGQPNGTAPAEPVRRGRHAAAGLDVQTRTAAPAGGRKTPERAREVPRIATPGPPAQAPATSMRVVVEPKPPAAVQHHRHAARPVHQPSPGPGLEVLAWTGFAAVVAWAIIAAGHDLSDATAWALGGAALVPAALLSLAPAWLRERRARRRDQ